MTDYPAGNVDRSWINFSRFLIRETATIGYGRQALRRRWANLRDLAERCLTSVTDDEINAFLGKGREALDPEANDMKALVAYCVGKGIAGGHELITALRSDLDAEPMAFLAEHSGKSLGEKWAPIIAIYWLSNHGDQSRKMGAKEFYDIGWTPAGANSEIRIELKTSSESPAFRFQQVRHPRLAGIQSDYDILLCLGVTASSLEWWVIPTSALDTMTNNGKTPSDRIVIRKHHGKDAPIWNNDAGYGDEGWFSTDERCRRLFQEYEVSSDELRQKVIDTFEQEKA